MLVIPHQIKELLKLDNVHKNVRVSFPSGKYEDICNDRIIYESLSFTESISSNDFKFGLCEASAVSFQCMDVPNIKGETIIVQLEIDVSSISNIDFEYETPGDLDYPVYVIPYGEFVVDNCKRDADLRKRQVEAYSKVVGEGWVLPSSFKVMQNLTWFENRGITFDAEDIIHFISPIIAYDQYKDRIKKVTDKKLISMLKYGDSIFEIYGYEIPSDDFLYSQDYMLIYKANYDKNQVAEFYNSIKNLFPDSTQKEILKALTSGLEGIVFYMDALEVTSQYLFGDTGYNSPTKKISLIADGNPKTVYRPTRQSAYGTSSFSWLYTLSDDFFNRYQQQVKSISVPTEIILTNNGDEYRCDLSGSYLEYYRKPISQGVNKITFTPELITKTQLRVDRNTGAKTTVSKSVYSFSNAINNYIEQTNIQELIEAYCELEGGFGKFARDGSFEIVKLKYNDVYFPSNEIYPSDSLYPINKTDYDAKMNEYSQCWYDESSIKYGKIVVNYKDISGNEQYAKYIINANYNLTYDISDNYLIKEGRFTSAQINNILSKLGNVIKELDFLPFDVDMMGIPYVEAGDSINIALKDTNFNSFILRRTLSGIQRLEDTITSD